MKKYCDTNLNYYIKVKLTEEGRILYKKHYAKYDCEAPKLNIDDEGYVCFQIHDFMHIFGERLFMGATLPCETNCKIQVEIDVVKGAEFGYNKANEWHYVKDGDFPKEEGVYLVYRKNGFQLLAFDGSYWVTGVYDDVYNTIIAWKEIVLPELKEIE